MKAKFDRRSFLRVAGTSFGIGALYSVFPALTRSAGAEGIVRTLAELNGEAPAPFSFVQSLRGSRTPEWTRRATGVLLAHRSTCRRTRWR